jgi:hypothetical protein
VDAIVHVRFASSLEMDAKPARSITVAADADKGRHEETAVTAKTNADTTCRFDVAISVNYAPTVRSVSITRLCLFVVSVSLTTVATVVRADTHRFTPEKFYNTYSFAHPPALRIKSGDRVVTQTIDAAGLDWNGETVASGPNPQTGPFHIEGAEPGDMLVVNVEKIETNGAMAYSTSLWTSSSSRQGDRVAATRDRHARDGARQRPAAARGVPACDLRAAEVVDERLRLTERGAQIFMGQATESEIANVVDPNFTLVAKVRKELLPRR